MSKKIVALSLMSLCILLFGCGVQNNNTDNQCVDETCSDQVSEVVKATATNRIINETESDIDGFTEVAGEATVAEKVEGGPIVIQGEERDS